MRATLRQDNGSVAVEVNFIVNPPLGDGVVVCSGTISSTTKGPVAGMSKIMAVAPGDYTLALADGRSAAIRIVKVVDKVAYFTGTVNQP